MTQKAKCPAEAATSTPGGIETSPVKKEFNMDTINTQNAGGATELPVQRVNRLAKELSAALNDMDDHYLVLVYPSASREYPVHICLDRDFADLMQKAIKYLEGDK